MNHIEDEHQKLIIQWARTQRLSELKHPVEPGARLSDYLCASANGGKRNIREAARMKAAGVMAGFPDLQLFIPGGNKDNEYHGLFIELKRPKVGKSARGRVSDKQWEVIGRLRKAGYAVAICYGFDEAREIITDYLNWNYDRAINIR